MKLFSTCSIATAGTTSYIRMLAFLESASVIRLISFLEMKMYVFVMRLAAADVLTDRLMVERVTEEIPREYQREHKNTLDFVNKLRGTILWRIFVTSKQVIIKGWELYINYIHWPTQ